MVYCHVIAIAKAKLEITAFYNRRTSWINEGIAVDVVLGFS